MKNIFSSKSGNVIIYVVIIFGFTALTTFAISARAGLDAFLGSAEQSSVIVARHVVNACFDEVLVQLIIDDAYSPTTLIIDGYTCTVSISSAGDDRTVDISIEENRITRELRAELTVNPVAITSIVESID